MMVSFGNNNNKECFITLHPHPCRITSALAERQVIMLKRSSRWVCSKAVKTNENLLQWTNGPTGDVK